MMARKYLAALAMATEGNIYGGPYTRQIERQFANPIVNTLEFAGLLEVVGRDVGRTLYRLTDDGRNYLNATEKVDAFERLNR